MNLFEESLAQVFGRKRLEKIQATRVGIAGLGGLGSNCAAALVRSGFRNVVLCDFDKVEPSNLNRQWYFLDQVGEPKADALRDNLMRVNPNLDLILVKEKITPENAPTIFLNCDVVVEAFDKPEEKRRLAECFFGGEKFYVSASGLAGWGQTNDIITRRIRDNVVLVGDQKTSVSQDLPPCAPRVGVASCKQADAVLAWVLKE